MSRGIRVTMTLCEECDSTGECFEDCRCEHCREDMASAEEDRRNDMD